MKKLLIQATGTVVFFSLLFGIGAIHTIITAPDERGFSYLEDTAPAYGPRMAYAQALTGSAVQDTYKDLLHLNNSNAGLHATTENTLYDGAGNASTVKMSQDGFELTSDLTMSISQAICWGTGLCASYFSGDGGTTTVFELDGPGGTAGDGVGTGRLLTGSGTSAIPAIMLGSASNGYGFWESSGSLVMQAKRPYLYGKEDIDNGAAQFVFIGPLNSNVELTGSSLEQSVVEINHEIAQSGTAAVNGLEIDLTITSTGDGSTGDGNNLINTKIAGTSKFRVDTSGATVGQGVYGWMYEHTAIGSGTTITLTTAGTFYGWVSASSGAVTGGNYVTFTGDATADRLTIGSDGAGTYLVDLTMSFASSSNAHVLYCSVFDGGVETDIGWHRNIGTASAVGSAGSTGILTLSASDYLDVRCSSSVNTKDIEVEKASLRIHRMN
jgi:hypothetical protein